MRQAWALPFAVVTLGLALTPPASGARPAAPADGPTADQLLAKVQNCTPVSNGKFAADDGGSASIPVCGAGGAVFWKSDLDIDCDGQRTDKCNEETDPSFQDQTAFTQSDGKPLDASKLPYIVVPGVSDKWDYRKHDVTGGTVAAVIHNGKVSYAVVGDVGPKEIIGEASYASAAQLGIDPDPATGGAADGVTFILFPGTKASPIEDTQSAQGRGADAASKFVNG
jgi:hypothetical protein